MTTLVVCVKIADMAALMLGLGLGFRLGLGPGFRVWVRVSDYVGVVYPPPKTRPEP